MKHLIISSSLNPNSKSRAMAATASSQFANRSQFVELIDLCDFPLPLCDGAAAYGDPNVAVLSEKIKASDSILIATPIYNFDTNATMKNLIELTGRSAWPDKLVGFICAAGGQGSYMSIMATANSLMLDFRCLIVPRFVYATGTDFDEANTPSAEIVERLDELVTETIRISTGLC